MTDFCLESPHEPKGDQPQAILELAEGLRRGDKSQVLLGATGTGKTFTVAHVIANHGRPTLVMSHNKTLAAQLYGELKSLFPTNAVEYFVSYYDYYQPEAYLPATDTYIEKDASINEDIERLRLRATSALMEREDVIIVASVSSIYGLGNPKDYRELMLHLTVGEEKGRREILQGLVAIQYRRNDYLFERGVPSGLGVTPWRSSRPMKSKGSGLNSGGMRSNALPASTRSRGRSLPPSSEQPSTRPATM